jgi:hypothetical protein
MFNRIIVLLLVLILMVLLVKKEPFYQVIDDERCDGNIPYVQRGEELLHCIGIGKAQRINAEQFQNNIDQCPEEYRKLGLC